MYLIGLSFLMFLCTGTESKDFPRDPGPMGDLPMQNPDLFGGDMLGIEDAQDRNAIKQRKKLWPGGVIPYEIDPALAQHEEQFLSAFHHYKKDTCIRFVERTNQTNYVRIFKGKGCYSYVGRNGGMQPVSIGEGCNFLGTVLHELGHAVGFFHEQVRADRDDWLTIFWDHIREGLESEFIKLPLDVHVLQTDFDYDSVMLYGEYAFSKHYNVLKTMVAKRSRKKLKDVGSKVLSPIDIKRIKKLYKCTDYVYKEDE